MAHPLAWPRARAHEKRPARGRPEERWGIEPYTEQVGRSGRAPGGWGAEDSGAQPDRTL